MDSKDIRLALRPSHDHAQEGEVRQQVGKQRGPMDDVVAEHVRMFRAEMMDERSLWMACYFGDSEDQSSWNTELVFSVRAENNRLVFELLDAPAGYTDIDADTNTNADTGPDSPQ